MQPVEQKNIVNNLYLPIGIGVFVAMFLLVFRPFGLTWDDWHDPVFWLILGLAPLNTVLILVLDVFISWLSSKWAFFQNWRIGLIVTVTLIIAGNVSYQILLQDYFTWDELLTSIWEVALIALFPTLFIILYHRRRPSVMSSPQPHQIFTLRDELDRETLTLSADDLLYIIADRNYVLIHTKSKEQPHLLRSSLKEIEKQLFNTSIIRCHRSYLVNTQQVVHRKKHARGLELQLRDNKTRIPVSNSYATELENLLTDL